MPAHLAGMATQLYQGFTWNKTLTDTNAANGAVQFLSMEPTTQDGWPAAQAVSHFWDFGDGTTSTEPAPLHVYQTRGCYDVTYKATQNGIEHPYFQKRAVYVYPDRSATPFLTIDLATVNVTGVHQDYSNVPAGAMVKVIGEREGASFWVLKNLKGTAANPIHLYFENTRLIGIPAPLEGSKESLIIYNSCQHVDIDMASHYQQYGGMDTWNQCTNLKVGGATIEDSNGCGVKMKADGVKWGEPYFKDMWLHNCTVRRAKLEGCYLGNSFYLLRSDTDYYKHSMSRAKLFRNTMVDCRWDGAQLGMGDEDSEIHNNWLQGNARDKKPAHGYGMQINSGFQGEIYNNIILEGDHGWGGSTQFAVGFNSKYYNNINYAPTGQYALFIKTEENNALQTRTITDPNLEVEVFNNTLISVDQAIYLIHSAKTGNPAKIKKLTVKNNIYTAPTFIAANTLPLEIVKEANTQRDIADWDFTAVGSHDFTLLATSLAIKAGADISTEAGSSFTVGQLTSYAGQYDRGGIKRRQPNDLGAHQYSTAFDPGQAPTAPPPAPAPGEIIVRRGRKKLLIGA